MKTVFHSITEISINKRLLKVLLLFSLFLLVALKGWGQTAPVVSDIPDQTILEGSTFATITLDDFVSDAESSDAEMVWTYTGNTQLMVSIVDRVATISIPGLDWNGVEAITFKATDPESLYGENDATFNVTAVNDAPVFVKGSNETRLEDAGAQTVASWATGIDDGDPEIVQILTFNISNDNNSLFSVQPYVNPASGNLTFTPASNANGTATVTLSLSDDGGTANGGDNTSDEQTFTITITAINDEPSFTKGSDQGILEDAGAQTVSSWATSISAGPANESGQTLAFTVTNDNNSLFSVQPAINSTTGNLTYTPAANANGSATVTVVLKDDGGTANGGDDTYATQTFTITVTAVNDAPSFTKGSDITVSEGIDSWIHSGWASAISAGPADEAGQVLTFNVTNDNNSLFSVQPAVNVLTGNLTYTLASNANGIASITVNLSDNGGGANHSADQTFTITVTAVNDAPILSDLNYSLTSITEDQADNAGTLVSSIIASGGGDPVTDVDAGALEGIAIIASVDNGHGIWEYTTDGTTWISIGSVSSSAARLFYADGVTRLRFNPTLSNNNAQIATITFRAWDRTGSGLDNGGTADITALGTGGITPFSTLSDAAIIIVTAVNDAPALSDLSYSLITITEDEGNNSGTLVSAIISSGGGNPITDFDTGAIEGIAVISSVDNGHGTWEYTTNGTTWLALGSVSDASARLLSDNSNTRLRFNPQLSYNMGQTASITFRAWDMIVGSNGGIADIAVLGTGGTTAFSTASDNATITVTSLNDAPVITEGAGPVSVTSSEDNSPTAFSLTLNATDIDGDPLTWSITSAATHGTATASGTGTSKAIGYTPTANYNGSDSFVVTVSDGNGGTDNITVNITINAVNDTPTLTNVSTLIGGLEDLNFTITYGTLSATSDGTDADGDALSFRIEAVSSGTLIKGGLAVVPGTTLIGSGESVVWTPELNANGVLNAFTVKVWDGSLVSADPAVQVKVDLNAVDDAPVLTGIEAGTITYSENQTATAVTSTLLITDIDDVTMEEGSVHITGNYQNGQDILSFINTPKITSSWDSFFGKLTLTRIGGENPTLMEWQDAIRSVTYHNTSEDPSTLPRTVTFVVNDGDLLSNALTRTINITQVNDAPTLTIISTLTGGIEDTEYTISWETLSAAANESDIEGDALSFRVEAVSTGTLTKGGSAVEPGVTLIGSGESLIWTPAENANGVLNAFTVKAWDGYLPSDPSVQVKVDVSAVNDAPLVNSPISDRILYEYFATLAINLTGVFADPENNPLTITAISSNEGVVMVSVLGTTLTLTEVGLGNSTITVTASDGSLSVNDVFEVTINDINFVPVWWPGNGTDHMNFYALTAKLDGVDLQPGDEIGIFDGDICVGVGVLTEILTGSNYLSCIVSKDDPGTVEIDGYTTGHQATFRIWDASESNEFTYTEATYDIGDGIFAPGATATFYLDGTSPVTQTINLIKDWNILSFSVEPDNMSLRAIIDPLITAGTLIKVQDEAGRAIEKPNEIIGWVDGIGLMSVSEGYKIKVTVNTVLSILGQPIGSSLSIPLTMNWNIVGYPFTVGQPAMPVFQPLIDAATLVKVQDEMGNAIEYISPIGWINNIGNLLPGKGYKIKTNINTTLTINSGGKGELLVSENSLIQSTHFKPVYSGNGLDHMNVYLTDPTIKGIKLKPGDEVGLFDGDLCVGAGVVENIDLGYLAIKGSMDDPTTREIDGFVEGHPFVLKVWEKQTGEEFNIQTLSPGKGYSGIFERNGTSVLKADFGEADTEQLLNVFPNPSSTETTFIFNLAKANRIRLEITNSSGKVVKVLIDNDLLEGMHKVEWDNRTSSGYKAEPGIYFYRLRSDTFSMSKTLVIF